MSLAEFSSDGHTLVTACQDGQLTQGEARVWDTSTGKAIGQPLIHRDGILCAAFRHDGRRVITGGEDFSANIWDVTTGAPITPPLRHGNQIHGVAFSSDGRWVATAAMDRTARLWDAESGEPLTPPLRHPSGLTMVRFTADNLHLITANQRGQVWCWNLRPDSRPIRHILLVSEILSGAQDNVSSGPHKIDQRQDAWRTLRAAYPDDFAVRQDQVFDWHSRSAELSRSEGHWASAVFHLKQLMAWQPENSALLTEFRQAQANLEREEH